MADGVELASAYVTLIPSLKGAQGKIASELEGATAPAGNRAGATFGQRFRNAASTPLAKIGGVLAGAFAGAKVVDFFKDSIQGASELEQSVGGVRAVFGKYAAGVERDSARAAQALGLSQNAYNELITVSGAMLKNKGLSDFAAQSTKLVGVGADLAAQFGGSTKEAVDALNAAMRGESDPIERYGISLNEAAIKAELAATGQDKLTGAALETAKTQARLRIITQQSADAHGAFARESDTLAGKQARLSATWDNLRTKLGTKLLPVVTRITDKVGEFVQGMEDGTGAGGKFANVLGDIVGVAGKAIGFIKDLPSPVKSFAVQAGVAAGALSLLNKGLGSIRTSSLVTGLSSTITGLRNAETRMAIVSDKAYKLGGAIRNLAGVGGLLLLAKGAQSADKDMGTLMTTLGGAATGFSVGGPVGAAVGGLGGLVFGLSQKVKAAGNQAEISSSSWKTYRDALDGVSNATGKAMRATALKTLQDKGVLKTANDLGFSNRQVVDAVLGVGDARKRLTGAIKGEQDAAEARIRQIMREHGVGSQQYKDYIKQNKARLTNIEKLRVEAGEYAKGALAKRRDAIAVNSVSKAYKALPKRVRTEIEAVNFKPTLRGVADLARAYNLTPKQIKTVLQTAGIPKSVKDVQDLANRLNKIDKKRYAPTIGANGAPAFTTSSKVRRDLLGLIKKPYQAKLDANGRPALTASANVDRTLGGLARRTYAPTIGANTGPARSAVSQVQSWINSLNTTFTLNAIFGGGRRGGGGGGGGRAAGGANRVVPRVVTPPAPRATVGPRTVILRVGERQFAAYMAEVAGDVYFANEDQAAQTGRAW